MKKGIAARTTASLVTPCSAFGCTLDVLKKILFLAFHKKVLPRAAHQRGQPRYIATCAIFSRARTTQKLYKREREF
jgi:hypothetical protein